MFFSGGRGIRIVYKCSDGGFVCELRFYDALCCGLALLAWLCTVMAETTVGSAISLRGSEYESWREEPPLPHCLLFSFAAVAFNASLDVDGR